ncbi:putative ATP-dependent RNA helicase DDX60 [Gastrophryne carolinensis]
MDVDEQAVHDGFSHEMATYLMKQFSQARYESLLNDYMETDLFLIDGDSLLIMCATNESLKQGQNLHFFYLVEQFLINLTKKGARYSIVFFEEMELLYTGRPDLISLRTQLKLHLKNNTDIVVHSFSNFLCKPWKAFADDQAPHFLMVSDEGIDDMQTCFLNLLILTALGNQISVVLTAGQESDNLRVFGYHIRAWHHHSIYLKENSARMRQVLQKLIVQAGNKNDHSPLLQHMKYIHTKHDATFLTLEEVADLCKMVCLSVALLIVLPLSQRAKSRIINAEWNMATLPIIHLLKSCEVVALSLLRYHSKTMNGSINWTNIPDLSDELLLKNIAYYYEKEVSSDLNLEYGENVNQMFKYIWETTLKLIKCGKQLQSGQLRTTSKPFLSENASVRENRGKLQNIGLIPISSDVTKDFAGDILNEFEVLSSNDTLLTSLGHAKSYDELIHWHTRRPLSDDYDRTKCEPLSGYGLRNYQKFQTLQRFYGKSLGMSFCKQIVVNNFAKEGNHKEHKAFVGKKETKTKEKKTKKKDQIIEENQKKIRTQEEKRELEKWKIRASSVAEEIRCNIFYGMRQAENFFGSLQSKSLRFQAQFMALEACFALWTDHCRVNKDSRDVNIAVEIMKLIQSILNDHPDISLGEKKKIAPYLNNLGFENLGNSLHQVLSAEKIERKYTVGFGSSRFQMKYMGPYLKKDERTDPDPRVQNFIPDTWQRELLDVVDNNESAVIVAPTSSGKTYASYYCIEKVLTESNDGVVVYVAPTKALVNQVLAMVINQFTKDLPKGVALCGVFTRDYRCDALNSQVLVTVPQCLEILLLSPHRQSWVKRIKYMIFDEVHCLGGEIGAEVWEHILVMIRCPFLALSATISNPEHLTEWLQSVKKYWKLQDEAETTFPQKASKKRSQKGEKMSYHVRLVLHDKRYNDLENYVCSLEKGKINFDHFHPCAALTIRQIRKYGIPKDLAFSPRESLQLYDAMVEAWPDWSRETELDPENSVHLKDKICITKSDAAKYEEELKRELCDWIKNGNEDEVSSVLTNFECFQSTMSMNCQKYFPQLVEQLSQLDKLPALFFAFDISLVETLVKDLGQNLTLKCEKAQTQQLTKEVEKLQIKGKRVTKTLKSSTKEETFVKVATAKSIKQRLEEISEVTSEFTYASYGAVDSEILQEMIEKIRNVRQREVLISLAKRGIGYHHGAMQYNERCFVEMLFRMGYIRVVTATSSLALGINMPCKSVVFLQNSTYLKSLNYRQMAGRAGRRGLDLEGSVYFFNIPLPKVKQLIKSNVPELRGQFPLNISLVLRLMLLAAKAEDQEDAKAKALSVLKHSLMAFKHRSETQILKMYFVYSLQFLAYEGYINKDCEPLELTGLATHLHYHEPSNFVFVTFLRSGLFHRLCKPSIKYPGTFPDSVMENLVLVLANLFGREYILSHNFLGPFFQSKVFLENLPDDFAAAVMEYNKKVKLIFVQCIIAASKLADMEKEYRLPLSEINFSDKKCLNSELVAHLMSCPDGRSGISPFACLSGNTDHDLMTLENVNSIMLSTIHIPQRNFPVFNMRKKDACGREMHLNSYALDFFKHGSIQAIVTDNRFNDGDAFFKLKDFYLSIAAISISLKEMCDNENDPVSQAFNQLKEKFRCKLKLVE